MFIAQFALGCLLIIVTVVIHGIALDRLIFLLERHHPFLHGAIRHMMVKITLMSFTVLYVFFSHVVQIWIWAFCYLYLEALPDLESSLYFSTAAFTTVGFGDLVLEQPWRLLSTFEAANGFILFGWSTAFIFEVMNRIYTRNNTNRH